MSLSPTEIAEIAHNANISITRLVGREATFTRWSNLSNDVKEAAVTSVLFVLRGASPKDLHEYWCNTILARATTYDSEALHKQMTGPCRCAYDDLPLQDRITYIFFVSIVNSFKDFNEGL